MNFTEYGFLLFFLIVLSGYWLIKPAAWRNGFLLAASYAFCGWAHPWYAILLALSTLVDYGLALAIAGRRERTAWYVAASVIFNLALLAFFRYYNYFNDDLFQWFSGIGVTANLFLVRSLLPLGLSFYTLKKLGYVIDVSRGTVEPTRDLTGFALFVAFFPQLTAGPIDRVQKLLPQIQSPRVWSADLFYRAWPLLVMGFFKKIVIANTLSNSIIFIFNLQHPSVMMLVVATLAYTVQIFADFSAYTDLARGMALLFGFETSENFNAPYRSLTPAEFWNRWHITFSSWLRDYIFFPVRRGILRARTRLPAWMAEIVPPVVTMLVSGLWHGVGWTYIVWGLYFGVLIVVYQALGLHGNWKPANRLTWIVAWAVMFGLIVFSFMLFRASSLTWLADVFRSGVIVGSTEQQVMALNTAVILSVFSLPLLLKVWMDHRLSKDSVLHEVYYVAATVLLLIYLNASTTDFLYAQF
jgi:D-alanyl-lipoteichoic acid acyltransferase DltB (MBOAT superfamily)